MDDIAFSKTMKESKSKPHPTNPNQNKQTGNLC